MENTKYDVFLSRKSEDADMASKLFYFLTANGLKVFESDATISTLSNTDYSRVIDNALGKATHFIVIGSKYEYFEAPIGEWVEYEWRTFLNLKRNLKNKGNLLSIISNELEIGKLPTGLQNFQVLTYDVNSFKKVLSFVKFINPSKQEIPPARRSWFIGSSNLLTRTYNEPDFHHKESLNEYEKGNHQYAITLLKKAASKYHLESLFLLGCIFQNGDVVDASYSIAFDYFKEAAERGHPLSQKNLGFFYATGRAGEFNDEMAVKWYKKAAENGNAEAQHNLAVHFELGNGVEKNIRNAIKYFELAANQGLEEAKLALHNLMMKTKKT